MATKGAKMGAEKIQNPDSRSALEGIRGHDDRYRNREASA
jgi:hypothetical protein